MKRLLTFTFLLLCGAILVGCDPPKDHAAAPPPRFRVDANERLPRRIDALAVCDTTAGHLVYVFNGEEENGVAVVPGGCAR